jgi:hypothetical protein
MKSRLTVWPTAWPPWLPWPPPSAPAATGTDRPATPHKVGAETAVPSGTANARQL